jgi:HD-like signal output (HDOD) protein
MPVGQKQRRLLSASEVLELYQFLDRKLDSIGMVSQPEVAVKLLDLSNKPNAQLAEYAKIIKNDPALTGRVLRLANSAFFAQRRPVTAIDRACVVMGIDRLKAVSLGFQLSLAAQGSADKDYSRQIWGESLFRACLSSQLAKYSAPQLTSEAFVVGLMQDAGLPLMTRLAGQEFRMIREQGGSPGRVHRAEFDTLVYTHVDVITALCRKWKLPELLIKPMEWHHTRPAESKRDDPVSRLHRIAYVVGTIDLSDKDFQRESIKVTTSTPGVQTGQRFLGLSDTEIAGAIRTSVSEYEITHDMFKEVAANISNVGDLLERVQANMAKAMDTIIEHDLIQESNAKPVRLTLAGQSVELVRETDGNLMAYLYDSQGNRMLAHRFSPQATKPAEVCDALGIDQPHPGEVEKLQQNIQRLAA